MSKPEKTRLDVLLVERGLAESRARAQALILAGRVVVGDNRVDKAGTRVPADAELRVKGRDHPFVSRGGVKLAGALDAFELPVNGLTALDVGASTGGFTDCLLQRGARRVYALDVGRAQLHQSLRDDERVVVMERFNVRDLKPADLSEPIQLAVFDLSFISLDRAIAPVAACLVPGGRLVMMVKPQFEVGRDQVGKGGIVRDESLRDQAVDRIADFAGSVGLTVLDRCRSSLPGADGNVEFFVLAQKT